MNEFEAWQKIIEEWKEVDRMKSLNQRLYDELGSAILYILDFSKRNNITLPNRDRLFKLVENIHDTVASVRDYHNRINGYTLTTEFQQRNKTTDDETEPKNWKCFSIIFHQRFSNN